jgi:hypothetical protein
MTKSVLRLAVAVAALSLGLAAPATAAAPLDALLTVDNATPNPGDVARVRVIHNSPDAPAVDVRVNGAVAFANLPFGGITAQAALPSGTYDIQVEPAGAGGAGPFVIDVDVPLAAGTDYTILASGTLAEIFPAVLTDTNAQAPAAGNARVRFFHGSPDAPAVDIALLGGPVVIAGAMFGDDAAIEVPAGSYDLEVRVAGTDVNVLELRGLAFAAGSEYTAYASGLVADGSADRTLYVGADDRFRVDVAWRDFSGGAGFGRTFNPSADSGQFWFFTPDWTELIVKVIDGAAVNGKIWVYLGSLSNVAFDVTVTDTATGLSRVYSNPLGSYASFADNDAFDSN